MFTNDEMVFNYYVNTEFIVCLLVCALFDVVQLQSVLNVVMVAGAVMHFGATIVDELEALVQIHIFTENKSNCLRKCVKIHRIPSHRFLDKHSHFPALTLSLTHMPLFRLRKIKFKLIFEMWTSPQPKQTLAKLVNSRRYTGIFGNIENLVH